MLKSLFKFEENGTNLKTEILAGITTFLAMAYILGVNPTMLAEGGMPTSGVFFATAISSGIACIIMGLLAKYPVGLAPGMGHNALFTYTIIIMMGNTWETALAATFISSILFLLITISGLTNTILDIIPIDLKLGIGAGIGFLLIFIGLQDCGIIIDDLSTLVSMGHLLSAPALLALIGIFITIILYVQKINSAIFIGLILNTVLGLIFTTLGFGTGNELMPHISPEIITTNIDTSLFLGFVRGFQGLFSNIHNVIVIIFSLVFLSFFDTTGTFVSLGKQGGFIDENGKIKRVEKAFIGNAIAGMLSSIFGTSPLTTYLESSAGIGIGGRTGLTAIVTGSLFLLSLLFAPIVLSLFTPSVTVVALVLVGLLMIRQLKEVNWEDNIVLVSVPMTIAMMIFSYSISLGIAWGFITYVIATIATGKIREISWATWILLIVFVIFLLFGL